MTEQELWANIDLNSLNSKEYDCENLAAPMSLRVETTGLKGGDAGHGGATRVKLQQHGNAAVEVAVTRNGEHYVFSGGDVDSIEIRVFGDAEMQNLQDALLEAATFLGAEQKISDKPKRKALTPPLKNLSAEELEVGLANALSKLTKQNVVCSLKQAEYGHPIILSTRLVIDVCHPLKA